MSSAQVAAPDHVCDAAWGAADDMLAIVEFANIFPNACATDAGVALDVDVVAEAGDDGLNLRC